MDAWCVQPSIAYDAHRSTGAYLSARKSTTTGASAMAPTGAGGRVVAAAAAAVGDNHTEGEKRPQVYSQLPSPAAPLGLGQGEPKFGDGFRVSNAVPRECLVMSGALDRTLCVFRACFGEGLNLLRRLNMARSPRGFPGALIVGTPVERANGGIGGTQLEVCTDSVCLTWGSSRLVEDYTIEFGLNSK